MELDLDKDEPIVPDENDIAGEKLLTEEYMGVAGGRKKKVSQQWMGNLLTCL